jgi:hypothetical protein
MRKFEIIEEGRLNNSEMGSLIGGVLVCKEDYVVSNCVEQLASCPKTYVSCGSNGEDNWSCTGKHDGYQGRPFGGGFGSGSAEATPPFLELGEERTL